MIAFLFAGQGSQYKGMGMDLYDKYDEVKEMLDQKIDFDLKDICFNSDLVNETQYAQPTMLALSVGIANVLKNKGIIPDYVCGLSLGEYSALTFSNTFAKNDALKIIRERGIIMQNALKPNTSAMAAIIGMDANDIKESIKKVNGIVEIANYNCPGQIVITGEINAIDEAIELLKKNGAKRALKLNVSGAFHSSLLEDASLKLNNVLKMYKNNKPDYKVVYNVSGKEMDDDIISILTKQIKSSVYFEQSIRYLIDKGVDTFIEIGPGKVLSGFVKKINPDLKILNAGDVESLNICLKEFGINE